MSSIGKCDGSILTPARDQRGLILVNCWVHSDAYRYQGQVFEESPAVPLHNDSGNWSNIDINELRGVDGDQIQGQIAIMRCLQIIGRQKNI